MKLALKLFSAAVFVAMIVITLRASLAISLWDAWDGFAASPWAMATLYDAYFAFTFFWLWVAYKERSWGMRVLWLVLIYGLGNIAMSVYVFLAVSRMRPGDPVQAALIRRNA